MWDAPQTPQGCVMAFGHCVSCRKPFGFNPLYVPSVTVAGKREPICLACIVAVNPKRIANGLEPITPHPQAYEPLAEGDLPL